MDKEFEVEGIGSPSDDLLVRILTGSPNYIVRKRQDGARGVQVVIEGRYLGESVDERIMFAEALSWLVKRGFAVECENTGNEVAHQLSWSGLSRAKTLNKDKAAALAL